MLSGGPAIGSLTTSLRGKGNFNRSHPMQREHSAAKTFPGLWLHAPSLLAGNLAEVLRRLEQGLNSPEHAAFVELRSRGVRPTRRRRNERRDPQQRGSLHQLT
jgi:hypothetical protein